MAQYGAGGTLPTRFCQALLALLLLTFTLPAANAEAEREVGPRERTITRYVGLLLKLKHYAKPGFEADFSRNLFADYFDALDPDRKYFTQEDLQEFAGYKLTLNAMLRDGDPTFAFVVYERFLQRLDERVTYAEKRLQQPFDFSREGTILRDRSEAERPADQAAADALWDKLIKDDLLRQKLSEEMDNEADEAEAEDAAPQRSPEEQALHNYEQVSRYFHQNDTDDVMELYLATVAGTLDPHSAYLNFRTLEDFDISMRLSLQGIGATLRMSDGYTKIVSLVPGGPAERDGRLQPGDLIVKVGQGKESPESVVNVPLHKVVRKIRGKKGTVVTLIVRRNRHAQQRTIRLERDQVKLKESEASGYSMKVKDPAGAEHSYGVVDLPAFYADFAAQHRGDPDAKSSTRDVRRLIDKMVEEYGIEGLVIDLRNNGGGSLDEAINLAGLFIPEGPVVQVRDSNRKVEVRWDADDGFSYDLPLVVLVNHGSASASEIFAGAIQDYQRGVIVGDFSTHGKGTVQTVKRLVVYPRLASEKPGALKYTMAKFYRVTGASTQQRGIEPDIVLPTILDDLELGERFLNNVLAWDEIAAEEYTPSRMRVRSHLPALRQRSEQRRQDSEAFAQLRRDVAAYGKRQETTTLSLNRAERKSFYEEEEAWRDRLDRVYRQIGIETRAEDGDNGAAPEADYAGDLGDLYLQESLFVLDDLVELIQPATAATNVGPAVRP